MYISVIYLGQSTAIGLSKPALYTNEKMLGSNWLTWKVEKSELTALQIFF